MGFSGMLLGLSLLVPAAVAQQVWVYGPSNTPAPVAVPGAATNATTPTRSVTSYHEVAGTPNAVELVDLMGVRKSFETDHGKMMVVAKQKLMHDFPSLNPAFANEWAKRIAARMNPEDYVAIAAHVYESHFSDDELGELVEAQKNVNAGKRSALSQALRDKLQSSMPAVASEIAGGFTQAGAKLGLEVAQEVAKEHPEWVKRPAPASGALK